MGQFSVRIGFIHDIEVCIGVTMNSFNKVSALAFNQSQSVSEPAKSNVIKPNFKANNDSFVKQSTLDEARRKAEEERKKQKAKNDLSWGIGIASAVVMLAFFGKMLYADHMAKKAAKKISKSLGELAADGDVLVSSIMGCEDPILKKAAAAEFEKGPQMRSEKKIKDILSLANQKNKKPGEVDLEKAIKIMDEKIVDMNEVKEQVLDFLIEWNYNIRNGIKNKKPLVLCLNGPAGTGKTTISEVIAEALGMPYKKIALGGATGSSIIKGTESKFVGSEAGGIAKGQIDSGTNRVLYLLDEAEKAGTDTQHGDIQSALLSLFDDQAKFADDFLGTELDISQSIFILTTNEFEKLSKPLKNRVKRIQIAPYEHSTKVKIAKMHLTNDLKEQKLDGKVDVDASAYEQLAKMTEDEGGRETTQNVTSLIRRIKAKFQLNEVKEDKIKIDKDFVERELTYNPNESTKERVLDSIKKNKPEPDAAESVATATTTVTTEVSK